MATLSGSAESLSNCLEKAEADLKLLSRQFEEEFHNRFVDATANPYTLLQRIKKLELMQELVDTANSLLLGNRGILSQLENKAGLRPAGNEQTHEAFRAVIQEWSDRVGRAPNGPKESEPVQRIPNKALVDSVADTARVN